MFRLATSLAVLLAAMGTPVLAADWGETWSGESFRPGFEPKDWSGLGDTDDGITIETGVRYWYSMGTQTFGSYAGDSETSDTAHIGEAFLRIDDEVSRTYAKAWGGYSIAINGEYTTPTDSGDVIDGHIGYVGADFGWYALGDDNRFGLGGLVGYTYWNDSPRTDRTDFVTATSADQLTVAEDGTIFFPGDSADNNIDIHALRLGITGHAELNDMFDVSAEVAAVPYAAISGVLGSHDVASGLTALGNPNFVKTSETNMQGWGYGAMGEIMFGVKPMENLVVRLGGRAWYLQGTYDATYTAAQIGDPTDTEPDGIYNGDADGPPTMLNQGWIETENPFSLMRLGLVAEMTYSF